MLFRSQWKLAGSNITGATAWQYYPVVAGSYTCTITNPAGCARTTAVVAVTACKEGDMLDGVTESMDLYPNPTQSIFDVEVVTNSIATEASLFVLNIVGEQVYGEKVAVTNGLISEQVTMNDAVPAGLYIVKVIVDNKEYTKQLVIQK